MLVRSAMQTMRGDRARAEAFAICISLCLFSLTISWWLRTGALEIGLPATSVSAEIKADELDSRLQQIATGALGERDGTIVVIDPQTGRVRATVNPNLAFQGSYPPGSTIKPFTALAALRARVIDANSRTLCREEYRHEGFAEACSHPRALAPLNTTEALAYSCNYYFAKIGERLNEAQFEKILTDFGFGQKTGMNTPRESPGVFRHNWQPQNAIGEGANLQVTPIQLLTAYAALLNGGRLLTPVAAHAQHFTAQVRANVQVSTAERSIILSGLRGAVKYGTAQEAGLTSLPGYIVGKTGTSTPTVGFRSQGWFVGFTFADNVKADPAHANLGVIVYLKKAHGAEAAALARPIFEEFAKASTADPDDNPTAAGSGDPTRNPGAGPFVGVHLVRKNQTLRIPLEEYVLRVVATEGSVEDEPAALQALAITARTYAMRNLGRHREQGHDFCSTTHCQRFTPSENETEPLRQHDMFAAAVRDTAGLVLKDASGHLVDSYFGASCGGMTANLEALWGPPAPEYLLGVRDEYCEGGPHRNWTDAIDGEKLAQALRSDPRTDVGQTVRQLRVSRRDQTGRAAKILISGEREVSIRGWEFKLIVGRVLGWNLLKSSRFTVTRYGSKFVFRGSGFGHGLGLCQEGAHVMAQRRFGFREILAKYFPGTNVAMAQVSRREHTVRSVTKEASARDAARPVPQPNEVRLDAFAARWTAAARADLLWQTASSPTVGFSLSPSRQSRRAPSPRRFIANEHFRLNYPQTTNVKDVELLLRLLESSRAMLLRRLMSARIQIQMPHLELSINETTGDFVGRTGQPWWAAAATNGRHIELQPLQLLKKRRILETTAKHELVHVVIDELGGNQTPRWLAEGLALYVADEGRMLQSSNKLDDLSLDALEKTLVSATSPEEMQTAYAAAYRAVSKLIQREGESAVWKRLAGQKHQLVKTSAFRNVY